MTETFGRFEGRLEDGPLVTGAGRYTGDIRLDGEASLVLLRSPVAFGRIATLDVAAAREAPGVLAVLTANDLPPETGVFMPNLVYEAPGGGQMHIPPYRPLAEGMVRYVGDMVAAVVAETRDLAEDALELIEFDIEDLDPVVDPVTAKQDGAPLVWPDCPNNICFRVVKGDPDAVRSAIDAAPHVVRERFEITRVTAAPMEVRGCLGAWDPDAGRYTLYVGTQAAHRLGEGVAKVMNIDKDRIHVVAHDTGGSFGMKNSAYPEYPVVLAAARQTGRPVRWDPARTESLLADSHSREQIVEAALALDEDGTFLALEMTSSANLGAYLAPMTPHPMVANVGSLSGVYRTPQIAATVDGVFTNTQNMSPYRGAGRPEAIYLIERLIDLAARRLDRDPVELRRRNMIPAERMPYDTGFVFTYDSGDFPALMDETLALADWSGFEARRAEAATRGRMRGIGLAYAIEIAGGPQPSPMLEFAKIRVEADGSVSLALGCGDSGMGHRTTYATLLSERIGVAPQDIRYLASDTDLVERGIGSFGSRTTSAASTAMVRAFDVLVESARAKAADELEVSPEDVEFADGAFTIVGTDRRITLPDLARQTGEDFEGENFSATDDATFPNGCHVCEVEVDPETGQVELVRYTVIDDVGTVFNKKLVEGQLHGGIVQGAGQALMERMVYQDGSGQPLTASFQDYAMPRAGEFPMFTVATHPVPSPRNALGAKGAGEAGVVGSIPAMINAVVDALSPLGIDHIDMPVSPDRVWKAIRDARAR
ncbi:xanthine dehydrogenase family protein molybdopterin-binding subunit [Amorphus coralli]|uniref:xanthine dehydrogenase family protein molybdopterin-binding subunit n=1 Tax=Amorphus coralli TaxID=340680 RepID=UPI00037E3140|nr:xanthine dehydrogenase family protein molybdopterin-binding subunit [Amorphus coralli]